MIFLIFYVLVKLIDRCKLATKVDFKPTDMHSFNISIRSTHFMPSGE